jgi:hypothetical protein
MIKKYSIDILCALVIFTVAFLISGKMTIDSSASRSVSPKEKRPGVSKEEKTKIGSGEIIRETGGAKALKERNIFTVEGGAVPPGSGGPGSPSGPSYTLIGILQGEEKKAVFLESGGKIVTLAVGKILADGSVVTRIDDLSVHLEKGKEKKELKVFDLPKTSLGVGRLQRGAGKGPEAE